VYDIEDRIEEATADDSLQGLVEEVVQELGDLADECESNRENMPEGLQGGPTGELLQERADALRSAVDEFEALDLSDYNDADFEEPEREEGESDEDFKARVAEARDEAETEYWQEKLDEVQSVSIGAL
jgi:predicted DNA-binding protein (UPF0251 family)